MAKLFITGNIHSMQCIVDSKTGEKVSVQFLIDCEVAGMKDAMIKVENLKKTFGDHLALNNVFHLRNCT